MDKHMTPEQQNESNWIQHSIARIMNKLDNIDRTLNDNRKEVEGKIDLLEIKLTNEMKDRFKEVVHAYEFEPVKKVVYGLVALLLMGVGGALVKLVLTTSGM